MLSRHQQFWNIYARLVAKPLLTCVTHQPTARRIADLNAVLTAKTPPDLHLSDRTLGAGTGAVRCTLCHCGPTPTGGTLLYLHGGAFMIGSLRFYRHLVARLGAAANQHAHYLHYALAPEHPFPLALDQATTAYEALCADPDAGPVSLVGDSAGGNLAFALLHRICTRGLTQPAAVVGLSPITDQRLTHGSLRTNRRSDPLVPLRWVRRGRHAYLAGHDPADPEVSPLLGTFTGAPPCLLHVDETELLFDDSTALAARLRDQGVPTTLTVSRGRTHVWHLNAGRCPEADASVAEIGAFIKAQLRATAATP